MTATGEAEGEPRLHTGCGYLALVREFSNGQRLIFCNKCGLIEWEDIK